MSKQVTRRGNSTELKWEERNSAVYFYNDVDLSFLREFVKKQKSITKAKKKQYRKP